MKKWEIITGDVRQVLSTLPDQSVQCCVTSPPYWGLRDYGTATWEGGDAGCDHTAPRQPRGDRPRSGLTGGLASVGAQDAGTTAYRDVCGKCGARRIDQQLGLERTPDEYIAQMVAVFREVRRVLRDDGTLWLNIASSYASAKIESAHAIIREDITDDEYREALSILWATDEPAESDVSRMLSRDSNQTAELSGALVPEMRSEVHNAPEPSGSGAGAILLSRVCAVGQPDAEEGDAGGRLQDMRQAVREVRGGDQEDATRQAFLQPDVLVQLQPEGQSLPLGGRPARADESRRREVAPGGVSAGQVPLPTVPREPEAGSAPHSTVQYAPEPTVGRDQRRHALPAVPPPIPSPRNGTRRNPEIHRLGARRRLEVILPFDQIPASARRFFRPLSVIKPKDDAMIPARLAFALQADGWWLRSDCIWCLSGGAKVYARTQKGDMPVMVKDLVRLNPATVKLWNGERWTQVLGWSRSTAPRDGALEIELRSGERIGCTPGHVWPTQRGNVRADELTPGDVIASTTLPQPEAPDAPSALDNDVAWLCGLYLAEGSMSDDTVQIAGHANQTEARFSRIERISKAFHGSASAHVSGNTSTICLDGPVIAAVVRAYIHGNSARTKGIKVRAWRRDNGFLRAMLEGYLEGDGHYDRENDRWRLAFTRNDRLASDFRTLAARLGLPLRLAICSVTGFGREWPAYRGDIRLTASRHHNARIGSEVVAIRAGRGRTFWDIGVEDDPHLFALASGVLTHNSKPNPMPESVTDRPTKAHEFVFLLAKSERYFFDADAVRESHEHPEVVHVSAKRSLAAELAYHGNAPTNLGRAGNHPNGRNIRTVWTIATQPFPGSHFAVMPPALAERCIKAGTSEHGCCGACGAPFERIAERDVQPKAYEDRKYDSDDPRFATKRNMGARYQAQLDANPKVTKGWRQTCACADAQRVPCTVLDPFSGAGTTGMVALRHGRSFVGIELNPEYAEMARLRIQNDGPLQNVPAEVTSGQMFRRVTAA